jgi:tetratricopeptide (TPR) repeat protein
MDQRHGGGHLRWMVSTYLHREVAPLLQGSYTDRTGRELFAAASLLTRRAGMMAYDCGRHGLAQRYFVQALRLAHATSYRALGAHVLASMAHQAIDLGHPTEAVQLVRAARDGARNSAPSTLVAKVAVMEARAYATLGDARACTGALGQAADAFDRADPTHDPEWVQSANEAYLRSQFGQCYLDLGRPDEAAQQLSASLAGHRPEHVRRRAMAAALFARAHLGRHDLETACNVGGEAIDLAARLRSQRSLDCISELQRRLTPHRHERPAREFIEKSSSLLQAV